MIGRQYEHAWLVVELGDADAVGRDEQRRPGYQRVGPSVDQDVLLVAFQMAGRDIGVRVSATQLPDSGRDDEVFDVADDDLAGGCVGACGERRLAGGAQQRLRFGKKRFAGFGEQGALWRAVKQADPEAVLQPLDLPAQGWLRHMELGSSSAEVQMFGDHGEIPDQPQLEVDSEIVHPTSNPAGTGAIPFRDDGVPNRSWTAAGGGRRLDSMSRYDGKRVVITGGSSGLGLAAARYLIREGAQVMVTGRNQDTLDDAARQLGERGVAVRSDAHSLAAIDALAERVRSDFGTVDALVVNAGIGSFDPFFAVTEQTFDDVFAINTKGPFFTVQKLAPLLTEGSSVVLTTSIANQTGRDALSVYSASKAALRSMARTLSKELLPRGIRVNAISPGSIDTGKLEKEAPEKAAALKAEFEASSPMRRWGHPDEFAPAVAFLAFDATYVAGIELVVDGGESQL